jgi:hypothetical protein
MVRILLLLVLFTAPALGAADDVEAQFPEVLRDWIPWVLEGVDQRQCPIIIGGAERLCAWPGRLDLDLDAGGGLFAQRWRVHAETWVPLPGDADHWPQDLRAGSEHLPVLSRDGAPMVKLPPGEHALSGRFLWGAMPEGLPVPAITGSVSLRIGGEVVDFPRQGQDGRLWLSASAGSQAADPNSLTLEVYRRLEDDIPLRVLTRLTLEAAGRPREVRLENVLLAGGTALAVHSRLPARLEPDGALRLQVRPGKWHIDVSEHHAGPVTELELTPRPPPWPEREVWVFASRPDLRQVEISGAEAVDPRQTGLPPDWSSLPAYLLRPGEVLRLTQVQRGDAHPAPDRLTLSRDLWLDFGGGGYSVRDRISGELTRSWRVEAGPVLTLGQVLVNGQPSFVTRLPDSDRGGVEVRQGRLDLVADGRIEHEHREIPASGWSVDLQSAEARLHLPPGWDLLAVSGVDNLPDSWVNRWTLLDLFLVLIFALGVARLWGWVWGLTALITLILTWHQPEAPRLVWLHVLGSFALLRLFPKEPARAAMARLRRMLLTYYRVSLLALVLIALPFLVGQVRNAIYPQLERPWPLLSQMPLQTAAPAPAPVMAEAMKGGSELRKGAEAPLAGRPAAPPQALEVVDPEAKVQTGLGVPDWRWRTLELSWNGVVPGDQEVTLWLMSPAWGLVLALVRLVLVVALGLTLAGILGAVLRRVPGAAVVLLALGVSGVPTPSFAEGFPSPQLLEELKARLLEPPDCLPACAEIPLMVIETEGDRLRLALTVDAQEAVALPVPGSASGWVPAHLTLDGTPLDGLRREGGGGFLTVIPAGRHQLLLSGPLPSRAEVELPLPLRPRQVEVHPGDWRVEGIEAGGRVGSQVRLVRPRRETASVDELAPAEVPPLLHAVRTLYLGMSWRVETEIVRQSPPAFPVLLEVPLIPGERVMSEGVQVRDGHVGVSLPPGSNRAGWSSMLAPVDTLALRAVEDDRLSEEWRLELSTLWHLEAEGIPPVHHLGRLDRWLPTWRPWPGEEVRLRFSRPAGVPGPTLTLDESRYRLVPGRRTTQTTLDLRLRSSQGGRHELLLPEGSRLERVRIDGEDRPLRPEGNKLTLPLVPGEQLWEIQWAQPEPLAVHYAPPVPNVGLEGVNATVRVEPPPDRWVLLAGGPEVGPAVLFWGLVVVLIPLAIGLGRSSITPLKGRDWLLLGLGLSQGGVWIGVLVAGCLFALGLRARLERDLPPWRFNLMQTGLALLALAALYALVAAVHQSLLGLPEMQIAGNGSSSALLQWYQDRSQPELPRVWVVSVPLLVYRVLMLAWALWLAVRLLAWLRWGWGALSEPVLWRETGFSLPRRSGKAPKGGAA